MPRLDKLWYEIDAKTEGFVRGMGQTVPVMNRFTSVLKTGPVAALGVFAAASAGIAAVGIRSFARFEDAMVKSLAIMGDVSETMRGRMAEAARRMARETTFSAEEAGKSFFFLASAGLDAQQSLAALPQVATFAQAGMFDMALATDLLTDAQSALGLTVRDDVIANMQNMAKVSDVLVKANTIANATVQQFSESLTNRAGSAMKAFGVELEEGVAVLAAFADQGVKGADAGTRFSIVLRDLTTKAHENQSIFRQHEIAVFDDTGATRNLGLVLRDLENALEGMSDEMKKATLLQLGFSDRSQASLLAILGTSEAVMQYERQLRNATGITGQVARKNLESLTAQAKLFGSELNDLFIVLGGRLAPLVSTFLQGMSTILFAMRGGFREIGANRAAVEVRTLTTAVEKFGAANRQARIEELGAALGELDVPAAVRTRLVDIATNLAKMTDGQRLIAIGTLREELSQLGTDIPPELLRLVAAIEKLTDERHAQALERLGDSMAELGSQFRRVNLVFARDAEAARRRLEKLNDVDLLTFIEGAKEIVATLDTTTEEGRKSIQILGQELVVARDIALKRGLEFAVQATNAITALAEDAADKTKEISTDELRTRVQLGLASRDALLARLRREIADIDEFNDEKMTLLLEAHQLELDLIDELNAKFEAQSAIREKAFDMLAASTKSLVDNAELELRRFQTQLTAAGIDDIALFPELEAALAQLRDAVETARVMEPLNNELDVVRERLGEMATLGEPEIAALGATVASVIAEAERELQGDDVTAERRKQINALLKEAVQLRRQLADMIELGADDEERLRKERERAVRDAEAARRQNLLNIAGTIESSVRGALDLGKAFGVVNDELAEALQAVGQIGAGVARIAAGDIIGGGLGVLGGLANLIGGGGPSPEELRRLEVQRQNTEAIERLTRQLGEFGLNITGTQFGGLQQALTTALGGLGSGLGLNVLALTTFRSDLNEALTGVGLSMDDLRQAASELGIELNEDDLFGFVAALRDLNDALAQAELTRFQDTFSGTMQAMRAELELFDITDPVEQLQLLVETLGRAGTGSPIFARLLSQFDADSPEARAALDAFVRDLFVALQGGAALEDVLLDPAVVNRLLDQFPTASEFIDPLTGLIDTAALGGLTGQELLDALLEIEGLLDDIDANTGDAASTQQFAINRSITEVTGSRIAALLSTTTHHLARIEEHTALMASVLAGTVTPILPPNVPQLLPQSAPQQATFSIVVNLSNVREDEARRVGEIVGTAIVGELDEKLGLSLRQAQRATGNATVSLN